MNVSSRFCDPGPSSSWPAMNNIVCSRAARLRTTLLPGHAGAHGAGLTEGQTLVIRDYCRKTLRRHLSIGCLRPFRYHAQYRIRFRIMNGFLTLMVVALTVGACSTSISGDSTLEDGRHAIDGASEPAEPASDERAVEGPWRVACFQDETLVFQHDRIYRVWHPEGQPPHWAYETPDGLRFRGRMGTDLNCIWQRLSA